MTQRTLPFLTVLALAAVLWVVPSIGSQGMGTIGERFTHADRTLVERDRNPEAVRAALRDADATVEAALVRAPVD